MKKLRTRFSLALGLVLLAATVFPLLIVYLLGASGLVEATYVTESQAAGPVGRTSELPIVTPPAESDLMPLPRIEDVLGEDGQFPIPRLDPITGKRIPGISLDPETGLWIAEIPSDLQRLVFTSPVFKFRVDMPAWLALGSLPLVGLLIGIFLSLVMSRSVTGPVSQLAEAARAIGRRELGYRVQTEGSQELQDLAQSFNRIAEDLERAETNRRNLMADVAHELRTPLTVLDGNLRALLDGVHELNEEEISLLYEQTHHLNRLVDDLRELSLAEADQLSLDCQEVDIGRLAKETVAHFDLLAREQDIHLSTYLDDPLVHPCLDENRIRQVLHNLLSNAFRYTPRGGNVEISAKRSSPDNGVEIKVVDSGAGMSSEELLHIFDRFYRSEETAGRERGGSGLGLAIVKAIIEALGGTIRAESAGKDQGSTFIVAFPRR
jgi:signal transduction histidine kinase